VQATYATNPFTAKERRNALQACRCGKLWAHRALLRGPLAATGERTHELVKGSRLVVEGRPHGLTWTHAQHVNRALLGFLGQGHESAL
jgi:hypothetical protein